MMLLKGVLLLLLVATAQAQPLRGSHPLGRRSLHPLCGLGLEFFESPVPRTLSFCTQYNDLTCWSTADDSNLETEFAELELTAECEDLHKQYVCAEGDPYQAHLFNLEAGNGEERTEPLLCANFCTEYESKCEGQVAVNCTALVGEAPYCYPVDLPRAGAGGLEPVIDIPGAMLIDYADPGESFDYDLWASFDGTIYESRKANREADAKVFLRVDEVFNQGELGFLTFELDPDYANNNLVWAYYSVQEQGTRFNVLSRFELVDTNPNNEWDRCEILRLQQRGWNHNGGDIEFVGRDLYLSLGDDAPQNGNGNAQDLSNLYGTVIRITPTVNACDYVTYNDPESNDVKTLITKNYAIPSNNPFKDNALARDEIFAFGFRNPWRSFQDDGLIYVGDVGQQLWEELDLLIGGKDYGWEILEGQNCFTNNQEDCLEQFNDPLYQPPVYDYPHFDRDLRPSQQHTGFSLTAGHRYTGSQRPDLQNKIILADFVNENIWAITPSNPVPWTGAELAVPAAGAVVCMRKDSSNESIILTLGEMGYKLKALAGPAATPKNGVCEPGESCKTDPEDCPGQLTGPKAEKWCCVDGVCDEENYVADCPVDCDASATKPGCGNNICDADEDCVVCPQDCPGHTSQGNGGAQFCCHGRANFEVECISELPDGCSGNPCLRNKKGNKNRKFLDIASPVE